MVKPQPKCANCGWRYIDHFKSLLGSCPEGLVCPACAKTCWEAKKGN